MKKIFVFLLLTTPFISSKVSAQTTLPAFWTFINPSPSADSNNAPTGWKTELDISVSGSTPYVYATGSDKNAACRLDGTGEYVKLSFTDKPGQLSYYIRGTGISPNPAFTGTFTIMQSVDGSNWTVLRSFNTLSAAFVRMTDQPSANARHIRFNYTEKQSGSNIALDSVFLNSAPVAPEPSIVVKKGSSSIVNGSQVILGKDTSTLFVIENKGGKDTLFITGSNFGGVNATDFSNNGMPKYVAAGSARAFYVNFKAGAPGSRFGSFTIQTNDINKPNFVINFYAIGGNYASEPLQQPSNLSFNSLKAFSFNVSFTPPAQMPEKFLVLRKSGNSLTEVPVDGTTYLVGDKVGGAAVAFLGNSSSFNPTYILANMDYSFAVFSCNGPAGFENYNTNNPLKGQIRSKGKNYGDYYKNIDAQSADFILKLGLLTNLHDTLFYSNYSTNIIDKFLARDTTGGKKVVSCVYTNISMPYNEPFVWWGNGTSGNLTREHTYAQSWMPSNKGGSWPNSSNGKELPEYNDLHQLFPADQANANVKRSNNPFGEIVGTPTFVSPTGEGKLGKDASGITVWEPINSQKGDLARALFYMCVTYNGVNGDNWKLPSNQNEAVLKKWHRQDPPSALEIARHELIATLQKNRNPFIDSLEFADRINFSEMSYIKDTTTTINALTKRVSLSISPNPSYTGIFVIQTTKPVNFQLYTLNGTLLAGYKNQDLGFSIDLSTYPKGIYYLRTEDFGYYKLIRL